MDLVEVTLIVFGECPGIPEIPGVMLFDVFMLTDIGMADGTFFFTSVVMEFRHSEFRASHRESGRNR